MNSTKRENRIISPAGYKSYPQRKLVIECCLISEAVNISIVNPDFWMFIVCLFFVTSHWYLALKFLAYLGWNSLLKIVLIHLKRYPAQFFSFFELYNYIQEDSPFWVYISVSFNKHIIWLPQSSLKHFLPCRLFFFFKL